MPTPHLLRLGAASIVILATTAATVAQTPGLRLLAPNDQNAALLVDGQGAIVHSWPGSTFSLDVLADGTLIRNTAGAIPGSSGNLQRLNFDGTTVWDLVVSGATRTMHHDIEPMPNGNVLVIAWDRDTTTNAVLQGRDPALMSGTDWMPDSILEIRQTGATTGAIVWEWHMKDHVIQDFDPTRRNYGVVANHPELLDLNFPPMLVTDGDWNHCNGLDYDPVNDWILLSARSQNEVYLIDHSTTTAEAAGHSGGARGKGGDFLWRWGNPLAYRHGTAAHQQLFGQHDPRFIRAGYPGGGHVTVFNNTFLATQSAVHELALPLDAAGNVVIDPVTGRYGPSAPLWTYTDPAFSSPFVSSAQRLANGNTLICSGMQRWLFEVTPSCQTVWSYTYPGTGFLFQTHSVDRSLWADDDRLSITGGQIGFDHLVDSSLAGRHYLMLGSISGTTPGTPVPGGVMLPLNVDYLTSAMVTQSNSAMFVNTLGTIGTLGDGTSAIVAPAGLIPAALVGMQMDFAHLIYDASLLAVQASNTTRVTITL
ncbi:MAG: aryl-sulfate sulfotransferase [Planctomycetes bacterium]|nr:aryl-sulfate sulfotransferase [Planctomycetota bacterium]